MTYSAKSDKGLQRAINHFIRASDELSLVGAYYSMECEEELLSYKENARKLLEALIEQRVNSKKEFDL